MQVNSDLQKLVPVMISILVILVVAILRNYSRSVAAIAAVMPLNIPLAMWIIYSGAAEHEKQKALLEFNQALFLNMAPFIVFLLMIWQGAKAGWTLVPILVAGYVTWAIALATVFALRSVLS